MKRGTLAAAIAGAMLVLAGCANEPAQHAAPTPAVSSPTPSPSPSAAVDRRAACRTGVALADDGATTMTDFVAAKDPFSTDSAAIGEMLDEMRAVQDMYSEDVAEAYQLVIDPPAQIYQALIKGGSVTVDSDMYRADVLAFTQSCNRWAGK